MAEQICRCDTILLLLGVKLPWDDPELSSIAVHGCPRQRVRKPKDDYETSQDETKTLKAEWTLDALLYYPNGLQWTLLSVSPPSFIAWDALVSFLG